MKYIKKNIFILFLFVTSIVPNLSIAGNSDVNVLLPTSTWEPDVNIENTQVHTNKSTIFWYIKTINSYLRFAIAWISMAVLIYAWILLITSGGDKSKVSKWWKLALSCLIAILVAMLSYSLVNLIVNLF